MFFNKLLKAASVGVALSSLAAGMSYAQQGRVFGPGQPGSVEELPAGEFRDALLALPPQARGRALGLLRRVTTPENDFEHMRLDQRGFIHYVDPAAPASEGPAEVAPPSEISEVDAFKLHSKPGAGSILYLDFDGHELSNTVWNGYSGRSTLYMRPFDTNGDHTTFSQGEIDLIAETWRRVAEDFAPFDIDVTTEEPPFSIGAGGRIEYASNVGHNLITREQDDFGYWVYTQGGCGCGGVAYIDIFGNAYYQPGLSFNAGLSSTALTISHETGHNLGLGHDGTSTKGYYSGHGSGATSWGPIMGAPWGVSLSQWSKGEYPDASNTQDDFAQINSHLGYRPDDHADSLLAGATPLSVSNDTDVIALARVSDPSWATLGNKGIIEDRNDIDLFSMNVGAGFIDLSIDPANHETYTGTQGANLDIQATLLDSNGVPLQTSNPFDDVGANIFYEVTTAGTYYLEITGVGRLGGSDPGYTDYASVGQYYINGAVPPDVVATVAPTPPNDLDVFLVDDVNAELGWTDPASTPESNESGYRVFRSKDGGPYTQIATIARDSESFSDNNLGNGEYSYYVQVYNGVPPDANSNIPDSVIVDIPTIAVATSETTVDGSVVSGSYLSTQSAAGAETLREQHNGGKPRDRRSFVDHRWNVTGVVPGSTVILEVRASAPSNVENEDFAFSYTANGSGWTPLGTITSDGVTRTLMEVLPPSTSGTVVVRVEDTDPGTPGNSDLDEVTVYEISVSTGGGSVDLPPQVTIDNPADGAGFNLGDSISFQSSVVDEDAGLEASVSWNSSIDGDLGTGADLVTATLAAGVHTITASVQDSASQTGEDSISVTVTDPSGPTSMHVSALSGSGEAGGRGGRWNAVVDVTVTDNLNAPVGGVDVFGDWSGGANGSGSCTTNGAGYCQITKNNLKSNVSSATLTVTDITGGVLSYDSGLNVQTSVTVSAP